MKPSFNQEPQILIIDDNKEYADLIIGLLERQKYKVIWAENFESLKLILARNMKDFDLIITDIEMPQIRGDNLAKFLNIHGILENIPLLICSGVYDEIFLERTRTADDLKNAFFIDFCEKGKTQWLLFKIEQLIGLKEHFFMKNNKKIFYGLEK